MSQGHKGYSNINLKQLPYLIALAEHGSISAAARALNMTQPSMSEYIAKLEKQLGIQLATRGSRGIQLTEAGAVLAKRGGEILRDLDELLMEVRQLSTDPRGHVALGVSSSLSLLITVPLLETIYAEYPNIRMSISEAVSGDTLKWIEEGRLDLGCVYETSDSSNFSFEPLLTEEIFLVTAPDNWKGEIGPDGVALESISAEELAQLPLVLTSYAAHGGRKLQERIARSIGIQLNAIATLDSLPQILEMVTRASAYSILPHSAAYKQVDQKQLALVRIREPTILRTVYLARKRSRAVPHVVSVVENCIRMIIRERVERYAINAKLPDDTVPEIVDNS